MRPLNQDTAVIILNVIKGASLHDNKAPLNNILLIASFDAVNNSIQCSVFSLFID